jgi:hypothetical protein
LFDNEETRQEKVQEIQQNLSKDKDVSFEEVYVNFNETEDKLYITYSYDGLLDSDRAKEFVKAEFGITKVCYDVENNDYRIKILAFNEHLLDLGLVRR